MKKLLLIPYIIIITISCQEATNDDLEENREIKREEEINSEVRNKLFDQHDNFFSNSEFKEIGNKSGLDMLYEDSDTLHIVGPFKNSFTPKKGDSIERFLSHLFILDDYKKFTKYAAIEHSTDLAANDCARYFFENGTIITITKCN